MLLLQDVLGKMQRDSSLKEYVTNLGFVVGHERIRYHGKEHDLVLPWCGTHLRIEIFPSRGRKNGSYYCRCSFSLFDFVVLALVSAADLSFVELVPHGSPCKYISVQPYVFRV